MLYNLVAKAAEGLPPEKGYMEKRVARILKALLCIRVSRTGMRIPLIDKLTGRG